VDDTGDASAGEVAYENTADEAWARKALDLYQRGELQVEAFNTEGVVSAQVWGTCPRCGHELDVQQTLSVPIIGSGGGRGLWSALTGRDAPVAGGVPDAVEAGCGCGHAHPGAPEQVTGCGVSFRLPTTPPAPPPTSS
jgi:hypothetical protein